MYSGTMDSGEPHFRELEPDGSLVDGAGLDQALSAYGRAIGACRQARGTQRWRDRRPCVACLVEEVDEQSGCGTALGWNIDQPASTPTSMLAEAWSTPESLRKPVGRNFIRTWNEVRSENDPGDEDPDG